MIVVVLALVAFAGLNLGAGYIIGANRAERRQLREVNSMIHRIDRMRGRS